MIEYCGEVVTSEECQRRKDTEGHGASYMVALGPDMIIDAGPAGNLARFANHSCDPNMVMQKWTVVGETRAGLFACRTITAGEELTFHYQFGAFEGHSSLQVHPPA